MAQSPASSPEMNKANPWYPYRKPQLEPRLRLFCFPHAGGTAAFFHRWQSLLAPDIEVCAVEAPGRGARLSEEAYVDLEELGRQAVEVLAPLMTDLPYALFGHSMGSMTSFVVAREARRRGLPMPVHLFTSAHRAPSVARFLPMMHPMPRSEFFEALLNVGGVSPEVLASEELMAIFEPILRADLTAVERFQAAPQAPLPCPITAIAGAEDALAPDHALKAWALETDAGFECVKFPGGHFYLNRWQGEVMDIIRRALNVGHEHPCRTG